MPEKKTKSTIEQQRDDRERKWRRSEKTLRILEILTQGAATTTAILLAIAPGTTYQMARGMKRLPRDIKNFFGEERKRRQFYSLLSYLQRSGLIIKEKDNDLFSWRITKVGKEKKSLLARLLSANQTPSLPSLIYPAEQSEELVVVIFDIPEKEKHKRNWLRDVLKNIGLSLVQKSVWMGKAKIPSELIKDLKKMNILSCVKIFSVVKIGNLN